MKYSFKKFVENKDLNEVGQYVFGQGENMPSVATSLNNKPTAGNSAFPHPDAGRANPMAGLGKHDDFQVYDKKNVNLGSKIGDGGYEQDIKGKSIFNVSRSLQGVDISFTEEMKQHLNNNNNKVNMGEEDFFGSGHEENEMIGSIGKSMLAAAGSILDNQLQFAQTDLKKNITRYVNFEPIFKFLAQGMKGNVSVFKRLFPLFERGLKTVVYELKQKNKRNIERSKTEKDSSGVSLYDAITKGSSTNNPNSYFDKTNIELKGYNVVFSGTDAEFNDFSLPKNPRDASDDARKLKQSRYKPAFRPPTT